MSAELSMLVKVPVSIPDAEGDSFEVRPMVRKNEVDFNNIHVPSMLGIRNRTEYIECLIKMNESLQLAPKDVG